MNVRTRCGVWEAYATSPADEPFYPMVAILPGGTGTTLYVTPIEALEMANALMECALPLVG